MLLLFLPHMVAYLGLYRLENDLPISHPKYPLLQDP